MTVLSVLGLLIHSQVASIPQAPAGPQEPAGGARAYPAVSGAPGLTTSQIRGGGDFDLTDGGTRRAPLVDRSDVALEETSSVSPGAHPRFTWAGATFTLASFAQVDAVLVSQASYDELDASTGQPLNEKSISLRRARIRLEAEKWIFSLAAELEASTASGLSVRPFAAEVSARWPTSREVPLARLSAGLLCIPFGRDVRQAMAEPIDRAFFEPTTMTRALFPGSFDLGIRLAGGWRFLRYELAVMNGEPIGAHGPGLPGKDPNAAKDFVGRIGVVSSAVPAPVTIKAGASGLWGAGFHVGSPSTKDTLVWRDANEDGQVQSTELQIIGGLPATPSKSFDRYALGADLEIAIAFPTLGALEIAGELVWAKNLDRGLFVADSVALGRDLRSLGFVVAVTQQLPWGFAVGVRFDRYLPDADAADQQGATLVPIDSSISTWSAVAGWRWRRTGRILAQYEHQTNSLGRALDGTPTTLGSDRLTVRAELAF